MKTITTRNGHLTRREVLTRQYLNTISGDYDNVNHFHLSYLARRAHTTSIKMARTLKHMVQHGRLGGSYTDGVHAIFA